MALKHYNDLGKWSQHLLDILVWSKILPRGQILAKLGFYDDVLGPIYRRLTMGTMSTGHPSNISTFCILTFNPDVPET